MAVDARKIRRDSDMCRFDDNGVWGRATTTDGRSGEKSETDEHSNR